VDLRPAVFASAALGQNPFAPPNVKGWAGGDAWIDSATLLGRRQFVDRVFRGSDPTAMQPAAMRENGKAAPGQALRRMLERGMTDYAFDGDRFAETLGAKGQARVDALLLALPAVNPVEKEAMFPDRVRALVADAAYQLK
jgi:hypothetical protein